jgi:hypothetical protein
MDAAIFAGFRTLTFFMVCVERPGKMHLTRKDLNLRAAKGHAQRTQ